MQFSHQKKSFRNRRVVAGLLSALAVAGAGLAFVANPASANSVIDVANIDYHDGAITLMGTYSYSPLSGYRNLDGASAATGKVVLTNNTTGTRTAQCFLGLYSNGISGARSTDYASVTLAPGASATVVMIVAASYSTWSMYPNMSCKMTTASSSSATGFTMTWAKIVATNPDSVYPTAR